MIADLVRQNREAKGWTQTDLAEATGLRQTYISKLEGGEIGLPRDHNLDKLAAALLVLDTMSPEEVNAVARRLIERVVLDGKDRRIVWRSEAVTQFDGCG